VRLIDRNDTSLAVALIASALLVFPRPLHGLLEFARAVDVRYGLDLMPGLGVLVAAFAFHEYRKRQQSRAAVAAAQAEAATERSRAEELARLVAFGRALGGALESGALRQVFWRHMPAFTREREVWMLTRDADGWNHGTSELACSIGQSSRTLEDIAEEALVGAADTGDGRGVRIGEYRCFAMMVGSEAVGVAGVRDTPMLTAAEQSAVGAAVALLAIAVRNSQLLTQTRDNSIRDNLTGCFNRAYAIEALANELKLSARGGRPVSVLMIDLDEFKTVNDRHGHLVGDAMLAAVGVQLAEVLRASDVKCRYGGDEFLVILPDTLLTGAEHAASIVTRAIARVVVSAASGALSPTASIGVTATAGGEVDPTPVIMRADQALYRAKREGRNRYAAAEPLLNAV
jgi:diguanylate cyclase (GGDEF)-like protein